VTVDSGTLHQATSFVTTRDHRRLSYSLAGDPVGAPVFLLHGSPGSRLGPIPRGVVLRRLGLLLISYDRPGYGESSRHEGRSIRDAARDVAAIADDLAIDTFSVVGRSGGGPHALACVALMPDRVHRAAALVSVAPSNVHGLDWFAGMNQQNVLEYAQVEAEHKAHLAKITSWAERVREEPRQLLAMLESGVCETDRRVLDDIVLRRQLINTYAEALRHGPHGWIDDSLAFRKDWEFDLGEIRRPVLLWHGDNDSFSPLRHTEWLGEHIPGAQVEIQAGIGHFGALETLPRILTWAARELPRASAAEAEVIAFRTDRGDRSADREVHLPAAT
jgi:pimeloyl-ACP methyl ester carboxylesterase